ncbi:MAG: O-antigen ligase family protein [bacterium]
MASPRHASHVGLAGVAIAALLVLFPLGPRYATRTGNIYIATLATLLWLAGWCVFAFAGPRGGLSLATAPQKALFAYAAFLGLQLLIHLGAMLERPAFLLRAVQLLAYMGLFATISSMSLDARFARRLVAIMLGVFGIECVLTFLLPDSTSVHGFLTGTFDREHNTFAAYLLLMTCILFALLSHAPPGPRRFLLAVLLAAAVLCLALSLSRTAYVAMPVAILALIHRRWGRRPVAVSAAVLLGLILVFGLIFPASVRDRFASIVEIASGEGQDISFMTRLALWEMAASELIRTGFVGVGLYGFHYIDNYYVRALVETGPIGFGLFVWFIAAALLWLWRAYASDEDEAVRTLALALYGATVGLLGVMSLATDSFLVHRVMGLYWVLFATVVAAHRARRVGGPASGAPLDVPA